MRTHGKFLTTTLGRLISGSMLTGTLVAASLVGGASAASASSGPCDRPEGIYTSSGDLTFTAQNCRSTTVRLQLIIVDNGRVIHREACTTVAPAGTVSARSGVPTVTARWGWTYC